MENINKSIFVFLVNEVIHELENGEYPTTLFVLQHFQCIQKLE